jgi:Pentapeptide repeats (9 copies)
MIGGDFVMPISRRVKKFVFLLILSLVFSVQTQLKIYAASDSQLPEQESWVLSQVMQGNEADLQKGFREEGKKHLRATFLEKLLTKSLSTSTIPRQGVQISNAIIDGPMNLQYVEVDCLLSLHDCTFSDAVTFKESHFKRDLSFAGSRFLKIANFKGTQIDGSVLVNNTLFEGESVWRDAKIAKELHAEGAEFRSEQGKADFCGMEVGTSAFFKAAKFRGPTLFDLIHVGREFDAEKAEFFNQKKTANFNSMKVDQHALFSAIKFHGPVDFVLANVGGQFALDAVEFQSPKETIDFRNLKVGGTIFFRNAKFYGPVNFELATIGLNFRATGIEFLNACQEQNLSKIKVGQKFFFDDATACCDINLSYGDFYDLEVGGVKITKKEWRDKKVNIPILNLKGTLVQRELKIINVKIDELNASNMQVKGPALVDNVEIVSSADFRNSAFQTLLFQDVTFPKISKQSKSRKAYLGDLTYNYISIDKPDNADYTIEDYRKIRDFIEISPFNTQCYIQLETFLKRIGRDKWANETFISMHDRDLSEKLPWWSLRRWLEWFFWGVLAGYGRAPFRVFFVSLSLIGLGALLYDPDHLKVGKPNDGKRYKWMVIRVLISLDRFLPIDLGLVKYYDSKACHFLVWFYFHLELILGWILIPIALASIYSQIK